MHADLPSTLAAQLDDLETSEGNRNLAAGSQPVAKTLVCQNAHAAIEEAQAELRNYRRLIFAVAMGVALFVVASLYVLIQFIEGDTPQAAVDKVVYALPIAGTIVTGTAMRWLLKQRSAAENAVEKLQPRFDSKCKGVLAE
jgi:hypothetical protein